MAKEKRTKPCSSCKKSKVKCNYNGSLPCERCIRIGKAATCQFMPKLPPPRISDFHGKTVQSIIPTSSDTSDITLPPLNHISSVKRLPGNSIGPSFPLHGNAHIPRESYEQSYNTHMGGEQGDLKWKGQIESRINSFDDKLNSLVQMLKTNQELMIETQKRHLNTGTSHPSDHSSIYDRGRKRLHQVSFPETYINKTQKEEIPSNRSNSFKALKLNTKGDDLEDSKGFPNDFRDGFLTLEEAKELFNFFNDNISQQLFGFEISNFSVNAIWKSSPVLICAVCAISSIHHPNTILSSKSKQLLKYLHSLCGELLFKGKPQDELEGFNTIVALVLCSFWLSDSQKFTGLALQLAKEIGLDSPVSKYKKSKLSERERLKLWYLLYVLDGQQSITYNRSTLVNSNEYTLRNSRQILISNAGNLSVENQLHGSEETQLTKPLEKEEFSSEATLVTKRSNYELYSDMRLISQVEYNLALSEVFSGNAWDLLVPSSYGIPSKSNLELDKWMVSWTVLLSPSNNGTVWSSKSTLIYYNFAKMHINSSFVRQLQIDSGSEELFPRWNGNFSKPESKGGKQYKLARIDESNGQRNDIDKEEDEEEGFISNRDLITDDEAVVSASIAVNAAQTVLNLVINDNDILENLKYVPVHIHIMFYYAVLLIINPPMESYNKKADFDLRSYYMKVLNNIRTTKLFQQKISQNLPTDKRFGSMLIKNLDELIEVRLKYIKQQIDFNNIDIDTKYMERQIDQLGDNNPNVNEISVAEVLCDSSTSRSESPGPERISAWPGTNHGHP